MKRITLPLFVLFAVLLSAACFTGKDQGLLIDSVRYNRHVNPDGSTGGLIAETAHADPTAYIGPFAVLMDESCALDNAQVLDHAILKDNACITENALARDYALLEENAHLGGYARAERWAHIFGNARVVDAVIFGYAQIGDNASITGDGVHVYDNVWIGGNAELSGFVLAHGNAVICGYAQIGDVNVSSSVDVSGNAHICGNTKLTEGEYTEGNFE